MEVEEEEEKRGAEINLISLLLLLSFSAGQKRGEKASFFPKGLKAFSHIRCVWSKGSKTSRKDFRNTKALIKYANKIVSL